MEAAKYPVHCRSSGQAGSTVTAYAGNGGIGYLCDITGENVYYAGGGGGGGGCSLGITAPYFGGFGGSGVVILSVAPVSAGDGPVVEAVAKGVSPSEISISAELLCAGAGAESVDLYFSVAPAGMAFLSSSVVKSQWKAGNEAWSYSLSHLGPETVYEYRLAATNDHGCYERQFLSPGTVIMVK